MRYGLPGETGGHHSGGHLALGVLIGGLLPCLVVKWLCGLGLIAVGVIIIRL